MNHDKFYNNIKLTLKCLIRKINKEQDKYSEVIKSTNDKINTLERTSFGNNFYRTLVTSIISIIPSSCIISIISHLLAPVLFNYIPLLAICTGITSGIIVNKVEKKKEGMNEKLKTFSTSETNAEKIEELVRYAICHEQAIIKSDILSRKKTHTEDTCKNYILNDKQHEISEEETEAFKVQREEISIKLNEAINCKRLDNLYKRLDDIIVEKVIKNYFSESIDNSLFSRKELKNISIWTLASIAITIGSIFIASSLTYQNMNINTIITYIISSGLFIGTIPVVSYKVKNKKDSKVAKTNLLESFGIKKLLTAKEYDMEYSKIIETIISHELDVTELQVLAGTFGDMQVLGEELTLSILELETKPEFTIILPNQTNKPKRPKTKVRSFPI